MTPVTSTTTAPPLSLEEVLHVYLRCFDAAADAAPRASAAYAQAYDAKSVPFKLETFSFLPLGLNEALARQNMCDWFCMVLEEGVDKKVGELFHGRAEWLRYWPRVNFLTTWRSLRHKAVVVPMHSVLRVTTEDDERVVMDEWCVKRLDTTKGDNGWHFVSSEEKHVVVEFSVDVAEGFRATIYWTLKELFEELDWMELRRRERDERTKYVNGLARAKFADLLEKAFDF
ncbi:hypothetical protein BKA58DRAFT_438667 [Alternaria rosae]|uniref:uncharacterized protein n=1 Tax=Alternaria rosae TaxID=1187941 RepID=UPI001E8E0E5C|nr:uncharacterized protein BKA58DRAFT_438667 [Alternaria rosae]KAH6872560.1 hypothetical protein BKA58DRAFT_438667 [Alternaria rosae]